MAQPANILVVREGQVAGPASLEATLVAEFNKVVTQLRVLTAKLDADVVTGLDDDYAALVTAADSASPALLTIVQ